MPDSGQLHNHIRALDKGDDTARQQALRSLKHYGEEEWAAAPLKLIRTLVESLQHQLLSETNQPFIRQDVATSPSASSPQSQLPRLYTNL